MTEYSGELSGAAGLLFMEIIKLDTISEGLSVVYDWLSDSNLYAIFPLQSFAINLKMKLAHARDQKLLTFLVNFKGEGGILSLEPLKSLLKVLNYFLIFWLNRKRKNRVWNVHSAQG